MINLPYNVPVMSQNVPMQTNQNNFSALQQPQTVTQQMQTSPNVPYQGNLQDSYKQPFYQVRQSDMFFANHQYVPNVLPQRNACPPIFQPPLNMPPPTQTQPTYGPQPQNLLDPIRGYISNVPPIFILPSGCHQSSNHPPAPPATGHPTTYNYPPPVYCPPSFYPYPIPLPLYEPPPGQTRGRDRSASCGCWQRRLERGELKNHSLNSCCCSAMDHEEHFCTATTDDTICSKRNCPASISLQALASQFLSLPGIISCAATRLVLRKVPGSNITSTMEDTMDKAQRSIGALTKDQLLAESRNAQQVNALINLHMTTNPPANIIPLLTLLQIKVNVLKAQVESLINKKVMECQGYGFEVETSGPIDPAVLALKTNAELRQLLTALRQKETEERVNVNFSPYHSQRVIAEARFNTVQGKIRQVEAEFENRRCASLPVPTPTITSRIIQQFAESRCTFGFAQTHLFEPYTPQNVFESPDPFLPGPRNPRRLYLKPCVPEPISLGQRDESKATSTSEDGAFKDQGTGEDKAESSTVERKCSACSCNGKPSDDNLREGKKKLQMKIDEREELSIPGGDKWRIAEILKVASNVVTVVIEKQAACREQFTVEDIDGSDSSKIQEADSQESMEVHEEKVHFKDLDENKGHFGFETTNQSLASTNERANGECLEITDACEPGTCLRTQLTIVEVEAESSEGSSVIEGMISDDVPKEIDIGNEQETKNAASSRIEEADQKLIALKDTLEDISSLEVTDMDELDESLYTPPTSIEIESEFLECSSTTEEVIISEDVPKERNRNKEEYPETESQKGNIQIVSIMTKIEYNRRLDFGSWMMASNCTNKGRIGNEENPLEDSPQNTSRKRITKISHTSLSLNKMNPSIMKSAMTNTNSKEFQEINRNTIVEKMFGAESSSIKDDRQNDEKAEDGIRHFPPLKHATPNRGAPTIGISKNIFHQKEIESDSSRTVYDGNTSDRRDTDTRNGTLKRSSVDIDASDCSIVSGERSLTGSELEDVEGYFIMKGETNV